jgi:Aldo/keto reductase family
LGSREEIRRALEGSLERLQTDYVDLYQHHREDPATPLAETIETLDDLVREGKIRAHGTSNYSPAKLEEAAKLAQESYVSEQSEYSWLERKAEEELLPTCGRRTRSDAARVRNRRSRRTGAHCLGHRRSDEARGGARTRRPAPGSRPETISGRSLRSTDYAGVGGGGGAAGVSFAARRRK